MSRHLYFRTALLLLCAVVLTAAYHQAKTEDLMVAAATRFVDSLDKFQKPSTIFKFASADRTNWHYFPEGGFTQEYGYFRNGLTFDRMDARQRHLAYGLLNTGLSRQGFVKAMDVMTLEDIVRVIEDDKTGHRDAEAFHFTIFGEPSLTANWGWRVEGHHLSLHYTIKNGELVSTSPTFFGANPHEVAQGPHKGMRALAREEDLAVGLLKSFDAAGKKLAIYDDAAPFDIITMADRRAKLDGSPQGMPASKMSDKQYGMLMDLIAAYAYNVPAEIAAARMKAAEDTPRGQLYFAWAGQIGRPEPKPHVIGQMTTGNREVKGNYYRVQAPSFLIEYANTQNQSNHSHSVWRDYDGDFGMDVLSQHYRLDDHGLAAD